MKNYFAATAALAVLIAFLVPSLLLSDLAVQDKQAPGMPGHKTFQLQIGNTWYVVPEGVWDRCGLADRLPVCAVPGSG